MVLSFIRTLFLEFLNTLYSNLLNHYALADRRLVIIGTHDVIISAYRFCLTRFSIFVDLLVSALWLDLMKDSVLLSQGWLAPFEPSSNCAQILTNFYRFQPGTLGLAKRPILAQFGYFRYAYMSLRMEFPDLKCYCIGLPRIIFLS